MHRTTLATAVVLATALAGCGGDAPADRAAVATETQTAAQQATATTTPPAPSAVAGALAMIPASKAAERQLGYVNVQRLIALGGRPSAARIRRAVLGDGARSAALPANTVVQIGDDTIVDGVRHRAASGGIAIEAKVSTATTPPATNVMTEETPSAVQSCLGDNAAQTIVGPAVLGFRAAIGASVIDSGDAPAGRKLMICAAPHFHRQLHTIKAKLQREFGAGDPVIEEQEIGERDIVGAAIALDSVKPSLVIELLSGGPALRALGRG